jgi:WD40 repeat protein
VQVGSGLVGRFHRGEVVYSRAWCPSMEMMIGEEKYMEWLVASISRDRTGRVWSSMKGRTVHSMRLPQDNRREGRTVGTAGSVWPGLGMGSSSGCSGEVISWDLTRPGKMGGSKFTILHREHFKNLFSISCTKDMVYTVGQDRTLVATSLSSSRLVFSLPCFAGFVYCLAINHIEPSTIAIGTGDGQIRV